jgi:hypothetical protein
MVVVEWLLGFGLLVVSAVGVLSLPAWFERTNMAHIAAREAARAVVVATDPSSGEDRGRELVAEIAANHGVDPATVSVAYSGDANPGGAVTAQVTVQLPALSIPFVGGVGAKQWSTTHTELVDLYRSSPRSSP